MEQKVSAKKVLLVDDDPVTNMINGKIISMHTQFKVEAFVNAKEALSKCTQLIAETPELFPDIIFLDINMPIMDGWEFLEEFEKYPSEILKKCSVYLLTSSIDAEDIAKSKEYRSVVELISKPLTASRIQSFQASELLNTRVQ